MKIHPAVTQNGGIISVRVQAQFVNDTTDANDRKLIAAFGDPLVNVAGTFTDPSDSTFSFLFPATEKYVKLTTEMQNNAVRFMRALPLAPPCEFSDGNPNLPGPLDCLIDDPARAASVWITVMTDPTSGRIKQAVDTLRANSVLPDFSDVTI